MGWWRLSMLRSGMDTSVQNSLPEAEIRTLRFEGDMLFVELSDERQVGLPFRRIKWLQWLAQATPQLGN